MTTKNVGYYEDAAAIGDAVLSIARAASAGTETAKRIVRDANGRILRIVPERAGAPEPVPSAVPVTRVESLEECPRVNLPVLRQILDSAIRLAQGHGLRLPPRIVVEWVLAPADRPADGTTTLPDTGRIHMILNAGAEDLGRLILHELAHASDFFLYGRRYARDELERRAAAFVAKVFSPLPPRKVAAPALSGPEPEPADSYHPIGRRRL